MRVLIAEDDFALGNFVKKGLEAEHYAVDVSGDGEQARAMASEFDYDMIVLDLNLPRLDGIAVLRFLRTRKPSVPVLVLTGRSRVEDRVQCLDLGADDYLAKPFSFTELSARIRALLRRSHMPAESTLAVEDLKLDRVERRVERAGRRIELTAKEFALLEYLMRNAGRRVTRAMIIEHVWNLSFDTTTNVVDVYVYPLPDLLEALSQVQQQQDTATLQLSTGSKINTPSDDPIGAAQLVEIAAQTAQADSYEQSIGNITGQLSTADSTLNSVVTTLQQVISLGTEGANGTLSATDRAAIVNELTQIQSQLISLANTSYEGQYLFAGTAGVAPYVADGSSSSGVTYNGNTDVNHVTIGSGYSLQVNLPGSQIFNGTGADVFQSVNDLITALNNDTGVGAAVNEVSTAYNYLSTQQVFYGNALDQAHSQQTYLDSAKTQLAQQQNTVGGADTAALATQVTSDATAENATLSAIAKLPQNTLFDYLQ